MDILKIDDLTQSVDLDMLVYIEWVDSRLKSPSGCRLSDEAIWTPELQMLNSGMLRSSQIRQFRVREYGLVEGSLRLQGNISSPRIITAFPFDKHNIKITIASLRYSVESVVVEQVEGKSLINKQLSIPDWTIGGMTINAQNIHFEQANETHSVLELLIEATRKPDYYLFKISFPLTMIVMMSWAVFWIDPRNLEPQMALAGTSMLTLIAFQFSMSDLLPRFGYFTIMDLFILSSSILVFFALVEAVVSGYLASHDRLTLAGKIDKVSRWVFPFTYIVLATWLLALRH